VDQVDEDHHQDILRIGVLHPATQIIEDLHQVREDNQEALQEAHQGKEEVHHPAIHKIGVHLQATLRTEAHHQVIQGGKVALQDKEILHKITCSETLIHSVPLKSDEFIIIILIVIQSVRV